MSWATEDDEPLQQLDEVVDTLKEPMAAVAPASPYKLWGGLLGAWLGSFLTMGTNPDGFRIANLWIAAYLMPPIGYTANWMSFGVAAVSVWHSIFQGHDALVASPVLGPISTWIGADLVGTLFASCGSYCLLPSVLLFGIPAGFQWLDSYLHIATFVPWLSNPLAFLKSSLATSQLPALEGIFLGWMLLQGYRVYKRHAVLSRLEQRVDACFGPARAELSEGGVEATSEGADEQEEATLSSKQDGASGKAAHEASSVSYDPAKGLPEILDALPKDLPERLRHAAFNRAGLSARVVPLPWVLLIAAAAIGTCAWTLQAVAHPPTCHHTACREAAPKTAA